MISRSKLQTQKLAVKLAKTILLRRRKAVGATIVALHGGLGAGKTTFAQGFMKTLGIRRHITSPTFLIIRKYEIFIPLRRKLVHYHHAYHFDLYRIQKTKELFDLGFKKIINDPANIVLIEWPERIKKFLPENTIWIKFEHGKSQKERIIAVR